LRSTGGRRTSSGLGVIAQFCALLVALYGTALAGRPAVLLNPRLRDAELVYQIGQSGVIGRRCGSPRVR
jgi:acyl-CoA synthetase (AMP-forming)/AMP-acid ligase II